MDAALLQFHARLSQQRDGHRGGARRAAAARGSRRSARRCATRCCRAASGCAPSSCCETAALFGVPAAQALRAAAAVECLHAYSLVHDDLPCMDDDDLRRGQPDRARQVGRGHRRPRRRRAADPRLRAARPTARRHRRRRLQVRLVARLAQAAGAAGMVGGQALDIAAETAAEPLDARRDHRPAGAQDRRADRLVGGGRRDPRPRGPRTAAPLRRRPRPRLPDRRRHSRRRGRRGKPPASGCGKDADAGKATFVSLLGLEARGARPRDLVAEAHATPLPPTARRPKPCARRRGSSSAATCESCTAEEAMTDRPSTPASRPRRTRPPTSSGLSDAELRDARRRTARRDDLRRLRHRRPPRRRPRRGRADRRAPRRLRHARATS